MNPETNITHEKFFFLLLLSFNPEKFIILTNQLYENCLKYAIDVVEVFFCNLWLLITFFSL